MPPNDSQYLSLFLEPLKRCKNYRPKFGNSQTSKGYLLDEFTALYGSDPFYSWIGLDNELMYAAHRAAGGMTSIYRQIGIGCERLFREIIIDTTGYTNRDFAEWSYTAKTQSGKTKKLSLDARLELSKINNNAILENIDRWFDGYCCDLIDVQKPSRGIVFEVRQGYKSKDSKRQNADIDNATVAWASSYLPVFAIFSAQIDADLILRYKNNRCGILIGVDNDDPLISIYAFTRQILNYDLADFFRRNTDAIKNEVRIVLETLLSGR
ncbi:hypothetical protein [Lyngbya sp. CCY1209]|uniref:hypothetical protein n=1 Tax=Lyngbya sp. CCY1209 TaxID=2886103 RepID=UPI002D20C95A|nr:hypothetical protein [Lyngbya sp. CCY1209]MEB3881994.1 hypothetical protein [Lyngbya sp. CCY1209]